MNCWKKAFAILASTAAFAQSQQTRTVTVSSVQPTATSYVDVSIFEHDVLAAHNVFRNQHDASVLIWNTSLAQLANTWASRCVWAHSHGPTGENLAAGFPNATAAIDAWGNERTQFNFKNPGFSEQTGHFSQLVWKATRSVGCGRKLCGTSSTPGWYVVCEYWPAGNVIGAFKENVAPPSSSVKGFNGQSNGSHKESLTLFSILCLCVQAVLMIIGLLA